MSGITYAGSTLSINNVIGNSYIASFSITNLLLNGSTLTTDPSFWGSGLSFISGTTASDYLPYGCGGGYLWLVDKNLTDSTELGPNAIAVPTNRAGTTTISFVTSIKSSYAYNLYYQSPAGVFLNKRGSTGTDVITIASLPFVAPPISSGGAFQMLNTKTQTQSATTATIGSTLFSYNTIPINAAVGTSFSGQVLVYQPSTRVSAFGPTGVTGTLVGSLSNTYIKNGSGTIPITYGITFDSQLGDFYAVYYPFTGDTLQSSENYVGIPPIYLPFSVGYSDFYGISGSTAITVELNDIQYNYTPLTNGKQVLLTGPSLSQVLTATNSSVTFSSYQSTAGYKVYFYNSGVTSQNSYTVPTFRRDDDQFLGNFSKTNVTNNGFTISLNNFDYLDGNAHSIFDPTYYPSPASGFIRLTGPNNFFKETPYVSRFSTYNFVVDSSIPFASSYLPYTFSFVQTSDIANTQGVTHSRGILSASETYNTFWRGVLPTNEKFNGNAFSGVSGSTLTVLLQNFDYLDIYGNSVFNSRYLPIEVASILSGGSVFQTTPSATYNGGSVSAPGGTGLASLFNYPTQIPPSGTQIPGPIRGETLTQIDSYFYDGSTGTVLFGVSGPQLFAVGTSVYGSNTVDSLSGTVLSSSSTGLVLNVQSASKPTTYLPWTFTGSYYEQPNQGHTGRIELLNSAGTVLTNVLYTGSTGYSLIAGGQSLTPGTSRPYYLAFYDGSLGTTGTSQLTTNVSSVANVNNTEAFVGTITNSTSTSFTLNNFDYLVNNTSVVYPGYTGGNIGLYSPSNSLLYSVVVGASGSSYNFNLGSFIPNGSVLKYQNSSVNFFGTSYKQVNMSGYAPGATFFGGWTGPSFQGLSLGSAGVTAALDFSYMYSGIASESVIYKLIAEVDQGIPVSQTINVNIPASELSRMLVYQSAWFTVDPNLGTPGNRPYLQDFIGGRGATMFIDPASGDQVIAYGVGGLTGPNVALLLGSVLGNVNLGQTIGGVWTYNSVDVLGALDRQFTSVGSVSTFLDDDGKSITPIYGVWSGLSFTSGSGSLLSSIPAETIASITNAGTTITALKTKLVDIDTMTTPNADWMPALSNLFAESAAYGRADDMDPISISAIAPGSTYYAFHGPSGPTGVTGAPGSLIANTWATTPVNTYGVNFQPGDSITLYITYTFTKGRVYTIGASVVQDLQRNYGFSVGNVASLLIGGRSVKLQNLNSDGSVNLSGATSDSTSSDRVFGIKLNAVASDARTVTRFV